MAQVVTCPHCEATLKLGPSKPGPADITCPECGEEFEVTLRASDTGVSGKAADTSLASKGTKTRVDKSDKHTRRDDDDDDDSDDERPRPKRRPVPRRSRDDDDEE